VSAVAAAVAAGREGGGKALPAIESCHLGAGCPEVRPGGCIGGHNVDVGAGVGAVAGAGAEDAGAAVQTGG